MAVATTLASARRTSSRSGGTMNVLAQIVVATDAKRMHKGTRFMVEVRRASEVRVMCQHGDCSTTEDQAASSGATASAASSSLTRLCNRQRMTIIGNATNRTTTP